jgi:hypothetical protein
LGTGGIACCRCDEPRRSSERSYTNQDLKERHVGDWKDNGDQAALGRGSWRLAGRQAGTQQGPNEHFFGKLPQAKEKLDDAGDEVKDGFKE